MAFYHHTDRWKLDNTQSGGLSVAGIPSTRAIGFSANPSQRQTGDGTSLVVERRKEDGRHRSRVNEVLEMQGAHPEDTFGLIGPPTSSGKFTIAST